VRELGVLVLTCINLISVSASPVVYVVGLALISKIIIENNCACAFSVLYDYVSQVCQESSGLQPASRMSC
jgi:hypothetical protein